MRFLGPVLFILKKMNLKKRITIEAHPPIYKILNNFGKNLGIKVHDTNQYTTLF